MNKGPKHTGELLTHCISVAGAVYTVATLRPSDPMAPALVPDLYEPVLIGFAPFGFQLRGYERIEKPRGNYAVVQEWHCELP